MTTECNTKQLAFHGFGRREVMGRFNGGAISSDGGGLLLCEVEQRTHILRRLSTSVTRNGVRSHIARRFSHHSGVRRTIPQISSELFCTLKYCYADQSCALCDLTPFVMGRTMHIVRSDPVYAWPRLRYTVDI